MFSNFSTPEKLSLANTPTPFHRLVNTSNSLQNCNVWLKRDDFTGGVTSGNKIRKLEFLLQDALLNSCDTIITSGGLQSNHCRATAALCAQLGLNCHLILRVDQGGRTEDGKVKLDEGNALLSHLCGAEISAYSPSYYQNNLNEIFLSYSQHYENKGGKAYCIPTGGSNALGLWGYIECAVEILNQCRDNEIEPDAIVCASGSGGTQGGLSLGCYLAGSSVPVHGMAVCDSVDYFESKIRADVHEWQTCFDNKVKPSIDLKNSVPLFTNDKYIGPGYAKGYADMYATVAWLARNEGVILDPVYTGKAFHGMMEEIKTGSLSNCKNIVFVHTGGIFGLFPKAQHFNIEPISSEY